MAGYPSNLAKKFSPTEQFPQHILPLLLLYNAQWWGYESLTAIVLILHRCHFIIPFLIVLNLNTIRSISTFQLLYDRSAKPVTTAMYP